MSDALPEVWGDLNVPPKDDGCVRCHSHTNRDGSQVVWRCIGCNRLVCHECTLCVPGARGPSQDYRQGRREALLQAHAVAFPGTPPHVYIEHMLNELAATPTYSSVPSAGGNEYMHDTLCSQACWERIGSPDE